MKRLFLALGLSLLLLGCGDDTNNTKKDSGADGSSNCGAGIFPCGPYGSKVGSIVENFDMQGFYDAQNFCKAHKDKTAATSKAKPISFKSFHLGDTGAACKAFQPKLMWVMVGAGWCGPCKTEVQAIQKEYAAGTIDARVDLLNIVFEATTPGTPINEAFLKLWADGYGLTLPVAMDPNLNVGAYFNKTNPPFNMLVDTSTMKIYYTQEGGKIDDVKKKVSDFLATL